MKVRDGKDIERVSLDAIDDRKRKAVNKSASRTRRVRSTVKRMSLSFFSPAMVLAATAGPSQLTNAKASEKKVWKIPTPTFEGSAVTLATPPTEQISRATATVTVIKMTGVR